MNTDLQPQALEFWYEFGSNYSYLSVMRIGELAKQYDVTIVWKPFLLGPIFKSFGWETSPFVLQKEKGEYTWQDMARQCAKHALPWQRPTVFPRSALLPMRVALLGANQDWLPEYNRRMMLLNFAENRDIDNPDTVSDVLRELGLPADALIAEAQSDANKLRLRKQTEEARGRGIFGAPTFFARGDMFWGNDRLEDALMHALTHTLTHAANGTVAAHPLAHQVSDHTG